MVVPYPPGIPLIMPGERFSENCPDLLDYLKELEEFEAVFPGFENDVHGVVKEIGDDGRRKFKISCIIE